MESKFLDQDQNIILPSFEEEGHTTLHIFVSGLVCRPVCMYVSLHVYSSIVQKINQEVR